MNTQEHIETLKAELAAVLEKHTSLINTGFMFSITDLVHAEACMGEVVDDLFSSYIAEAEEDAQLEANAERRANEREWRV